MSEPSAGGRRPDARWLETARREWDARAREDAQYYIYTPGAADDAAFFASGGADYEKFIAPLLRRMEFDPAGKRALEIGCGIGRLARRTLQDFGRYVGVDVSAEMIRRAAAYGLPGAAFEVVSGGDLAPVETASVDFAFSYAVLQHVPDRRAILRYLEEVARVLKPGGLFSLQMKGLATVAVGRLALEAGLSERSFIGGKRMPFVRIRHLDSWQGRSVSPRILRRACRDLGLEIRELRGAWTVHFWLGGAKP